MENKIIEELKLDIFGKDNASEIASGIMNLMIEHGLLK